MSSCHRIKSCVLGILLTGVFVPAMGQNAKSLEMIAKLQNLQFDQLGSPQIQSNAIPAVLEFN